MVEGHYKLETFSLLFLLFFVSLASVSAFSSVNIYIENTGEASFFGVSDSEIILPEGVILENGRISGSTQELTSKIGETWNFSYRLSESELNVFLPDGAVIRDTNGETNIEDGKFVVYAKDVLSIEYIIEDVQSYSYIWIIGILIVAGLVAYFIWSKKKKIKVYPKEFLNSRENEIIEKLKETGKIKSSYLRKMLEMPKASFSRHIIELEKKGIVKKDGEGKNKFVELK